MVKQRTHQNAFSRHIREELFTAVPKLNIFGTTPEVAETEAELDGTNSEAHFGLDLELQDDSEIIKRLFAHAKFLYGEGVSYGATKIRIQKARIITAQEKKDSNDTVKLQARIDDLEAKKESINLAKGEKKNNRRTPARDWQHGNSRRT